MLQIWLFLQLRAADNDNFVFQQDGAPPHWKLEVRRYLNNEWWIAARTRIQVY